MPIKRPKSTSTPGNQIECTCDNCGQVISQAETESEALTIAENRGADITRKHGITIINCRDCWIDPDRE